MSSPSSLLLPEKGEDWPIRMVVLVTPWAWPAPTANTQASAPTAAVHVRIIVIALTPRYGDATRTADSRSSTLSTDWVCCQAGPARCPLCAGIMASKAVLQLDDS